MTRLVPVMIAWCFDDGLIETGIDLPVGATWLARGEAPLLRAALLKTAQHDGNALVFHVPGVAGAKPEAAWEAAQAFRYRMYRALRRSNIKGERPGIDAETVMRRSLDFIHAGDISQAGWLLETALTDITTQLQRSPLL